MGNIGKEGDPKENEPQPKGLYVVVAESNTKWSGKIKRALETNGQINVESDLVDNFEQLLNSAMIGKGFRNQADVVILGDFDKTTMNAWSPHYHPSRIKLEYVLADKIKDEDDIPSLTGLPDSLKLATTLRLIGFRGSIVLVKESAPAEDIIFNHEELYGVERIVDAKTDNKPFVGEFLYYLRDSDEDGGAFQYHFEKSQQLSDVLGNILMHTVNLNPQE